MHKDTEVNLSAFIYRVFHEDFSSIIGTNTILVICSWIMFVPMTEEKSS